MRKWILTLCILMISGMIVADICLVGLEEAGVLIDKEVFQSYAYSLVGFQETIWNLLYERIKLVAFLILLFLTPIRKYLPVIFAGVFAFFYGFFFMNCILTLGFVGVVVGLGAVFPHGIFYVAIFLSLLGREGRHTYRRGKLIPQNILTYILAVLFFLTGCILECIMGVHFIPWIIRLSNI